MFTGCSGYLYTICRIQTKSPGALAGATGADKKADDLSEEVNNKAAFLTILTDIRFLREAPIGGTHLREISTPEPLTKATFFQATGPREGAIINELFEDETGELHLTFYCYLGPREAPTGAEEQVGQVQFDSDQGYKAAFLSTLKRTRETLAGTL